MTVGHKLGEHICRILSRPFTPQINWIFWNATRKKPSKPMEINQMEYGGWNPVWTEIGEKTLEFKVSLQKTLKDASEKNNALRRLKPGFEGSTH
ncbi:hypothetical protein AVEN_40272-1 [Araneus ventricosus]|uniref:Uncharacterized protein n=1 Tax=Araneus ventricosus TaxID=182803 RepID=A0A4Y2U0H9_ARAVE|nr:hypothetical protein AVEN_98560-1 [Araneus ventricosus]GBO06388.1 hypothetical protein AVEN_103981-1 [Araneus ventricosus]GBO06390.1 hypothetical protein AVEN_237848-1 [Araneus ventricosus]GBO06394.1 hypothetical protein AVEN_40272-1 [Araneus ventricosus]